MLNEVCENKPGVSSAGGINLSAINLNGYCEGSNLNFMHCDFMTSLQRVSEGGKGRLDSAIAAMRFCIGHRSIHMYGQVKENTG